MKDEGFVLRQTLEIESMIDFSCSCWASYLVYALLDQYSLNASF